MRIAKVSSTLRGTNTLPTAPIPEDLKDTPIQLTENARIVLQKRYLRRGEDGKPAETEHQMFWRVAYHVALAELEFADHTRRSRSRRAPTSSCSPSCASFRIARRSQAQARRSVSWRHVLCLPLMTTWDALRAVSSRLCAMQR
jgi:hypothetical protein